MPLLISFDPAFSWNDVFLTFLLVLTLGLLWKSMSYGNKDLQIVREIQLLILFLDSTIERLREPWLKLKYLTSTLILTVLSLILSSHSFHQDYYHFNHFSFFFILWSSVFVVFYIYGKLQDDTIEARKFFVWSLICFLTVIYVFCKWRELLASTIAVVFGLVSILLAIDRLVSLYMEVRRKYYNGENLTFAQLCFSQTDYDRLFAKLVIPTSMDRVEKPNLWGLIFIGKTVPDYDIARAYFIESLRRNEFDTDAKFYLALTNIITDRNISEGLKLLEEVRNEHDKKGLFWESARTNIDFWTATALMKLNPPDYSRARELLENIIDSHFASFEAVLPLIRCLVSLPFPEPIQAKKLLDHFFDRDSGLEEVTELYSIVDEMLET